MKLPKVRKSILHTCHNIDTLTLSKIYKAEAEAEAEAETETETETETFYTATQLIIVKFFS